jgi:DNA replication protein DnaC
MLVDREALERDSKRLAARLRFAGLRQQATPEDVDHRAARDLDRAPFQGLTEWIERHQDLLVTGPTGTGKTWLSCALGHRACRDNRSVLYQRVPRRLEALGLARGDGRYARMLKNLARVQLLILDDWAELAKGCVGEADGMPAEGITPLTAEQRRDLMEIVDDRHDRASTIVTSQVPVEHWHEHIGNPTIADAVLDRLVHGAHRLELKGESMRADSNDCGQAFQSKPSIDSNPSRTGIPTIPAMIVIGVAMRSGAGFGVRHQRLGSPLSQ